MGSLSEKYEMADSILGNLLGICYRELRAAKKSSDSSKAEVERLSSRFQNCYARREMLRDADETMLQEVIDSIGPAVANDVASLRG